MKEYIITSIICHIIANFLIGLNTPLAYLGSHLIIGISVAVLYNLIEESIDRYNSVATTRVSIIPIRFCIGVFWVLPLIILFLMIVGFKVLFITGIWCTLCFCAVIVSVIWAIIEFRKINISYLWALLIYIPIVNLFVLYKVLKVLDEKTKKMLLYQG